MEKNEYLKGGCICGQVRYKITEKPLFTQACHCTDCKVLTGSSYIVNTSVLENTLIVEGKVSSSIELKAGSGASYRTYFCNECGTYVYADYDSAVGRLTVRTKTLDDSDNYPPQVHIFIKDKDPWLNLTDDVNCYEKMYDQKTEWPEESLIRYKDYLKTRENK
tara:strand:+ start:203 stop:691 length:489 start_codon:yes stop_codon:yes gene_type:complete